ncbi:GNAT family N-acetyltransferase [Virgibacillus litoralis]|uniref:Ribosomal-protein-alanine N-acetyltransferase n=1 Tax=Virgibacillus litoralis TaxID=578221 RepID=A0ABS4HIY0_9BACI|nr:GNAT family N-acetyltransferase [Virgibacillus litoralis]MBP1950887.1 ribosomal-protein-alanine N-acetyltransferase [Virgibacillus litoralis]
MDITIERLHSTDAGNLYEFELENRVYFEGMVPSRGNDYYDFETFKKKTNALLDEQEQGLSYFYLIKNKDGLILGRMNLVDIENGLGHIGYRVGKAYTGKGIANTALKLLLDVINNQGIKQVSAKTTTNNIASQKVLEKNGFKYIATSDEEFIMNEQKVKFVYYLLTN